MAITLRIDNFDQLPDGGPIEFSAGPRGFDIGRESHLDWSLPDPNRIISGHHAQVRFENGAYWLHDISRNGTFVNGAPGRVQSPYRLNNGDRLQIGQYFIRVTMSGGAEPAQQAGYQDPYPPAEGGDMWSTGGATPQAVDRRWFANEQKKGPRAPDVMDSFMDLPAARRGSSPQQGGGQQFGNVPGSQVYDRTGIGGTSQQWSPGAPAGRPPDPAPSYAAPVTGYPQPQGGAGMQLPAGAFLTALATAAGISPQAFSNRDPGEIAGELGTILRTVAEQLTGLLLARAAAKLMAKSSNRTMIGSDNNNPLKFIPDPREALEIMFQRSRPGYLSASASVKEGFDNIKSHEMATYSAMQKALLRLMEDIAPERIEEKAGGGAFGSKKSRAWEIYVERWNAKTEHYENGILDVFLAYFAEAYDAATKK